MNCKFLRFSFRIAALAAAAGIAAGCNHAATPYASSPLPSPSSAPAHLVYVADFTGNAILAFPDSVTGQAAFASIAGAATTLSAPMGVTTDASGNVWVANSLANSITEYPAKTFGNVAPIATVAGSNTTLNHPGALVLDSSGNVWVANTGASDVVEFSAGANGNAAPSDTITSSVFENPNALAFDSSGLLWVSSFSQSSFDAGNISAFHKTDGLNATPTAELDGNNSTTQVSLPTGVAFDAAGDLVAGQFGSDTVNVYPSPVGGNEAPSSVTGGGIWSGAGPWGIAIDSAGNLFGVDCNPIAGQSPNPAVRIFLAGAFNGPGTFFSNGLANPMRDPVGVWVH